MLNMISYILGILIPLSLPILFGVSLFMYCYAKRKNKKAPGTYTDGQINGRLIFLIVTSILFGMLLMLLIGFVILLSGAIAFM